MSTTLLQNETQETSVSQVAATTIFRALTGRSAISEQSIEANAQNLIHTSYQLTLLTVKITQNTLNGTSTIKSRVNGADGTLAVSIPAGATGEAVDTGPGDALVNGDLVCSASVAGGSSGSYRPIRIYCGLVDEAGDKSILGLCGQSGFGEFTTAITRWVPIAGFINAGGSVEANQPYTVRATATFAHLRVFVNQNSITAASTFSTKKNSTTGGQSVSITGNTTGSFEDASGSDSLVDSDTLHYEVVPG